MAEQDMSTYSGAEQEALPETESESPQAAETASVAGQGEYQTLQNQYLRLAADFENFRKRQAQERENLFKYGAQHTLESLLPVLDNLSRAQKSLNEQSDPKMLFKSFEMLSQQLLDALKQAGLEKMSLEGAQFDPERHEAISQVENADLPEHSIVEVYQDGYMLKDRVLRPAQVVVSVSPAEAVGSCVVGGMETAPIGEIRENPFQQPVTGQQGDV